MLNLIKFAGCFRDFHVTSHFSLFSLERFLCNFIYFYVDEKSEQVAFRFAILARNQNKKIKANRLVRLCCRFIDMLHTCNMFFCSFVLFEKCRCVYTYFIAWFACVDLTYTHSVLSRFYAYYYCSTVWHERRLHSNKSCAKYKPGQ